MIILFTGHRDKQIKPERLTIISHQYPFSTWMHGGAFGFDTQVQKYAVEHGIETKVVRPDYEKYPFRVAPLVRNREMVRKADLVIACYDGRKYGGTKYTIDYARKVGKEVILIDPSDIVEAL